MRKLNTTAHEQPMKFTFKIRLMLILLACVSLHSTPNWAGSLNCRIEPHLLIDISSPVEGLVSEVLVDRNQLVEKGQVLALLESSVEAATVDLRRAQAEMNSDIDAKRLAYEFSQRNLKRINNLYKKKAISYAKLDEAKTENALAAQQLQQSKDRKLQAHLEFVRAEKLLARRTITSPVDGLVVARYKDPGEHIDNEPLLQLAQLDPLKVEVFAPASLFGKITVGISAKVIPQSSGRKRSYLAEVTMVDQIIDAPSHTFGIRLSFPNPDNRLPSGLKCRVDFPDSVLPPATDNNLDDQKTY